MLVKALAAFFILVYIHISYSQTPATCLSHLKTEGWPRDGILRVEILRPGEVKVPMKEGAEDMSEELTMLRINHKGGMVSIDPSSTLPHEDNNPSDPAYKHYASSKHQTATPDRIDANQTDSDDIRFTEHLKNFEVNISESIQIEVSESVSSTMQIENSALAGESIAMTDSDMNTKETYTNDTMAKITDHHHQYEDVLKTDIPEVEKLMNAGELADDYLPSFKTEFLIVQLSVFPDDQYVVECKQTCNWRKF